MPRYRTHLIVCRKDAELIGKLKFANHLLILRNEPTKCFWETRDGRSHIYKKDGNYPNNVSEEEIPQFELIIESESDEFAENLLSLIHAGVLIRCPEPSLTTSFTFITRINKVDEVNYTDVHLRKFFKRIENLGFGCLFAEATICDPEMIYAVEKYKLSLELYSITPHSTHPRYGQIFELHDVQRRSHVRSAFAIISAFSVIEELGLEIRSSSKHPRFTDAKQGIWNEKVLRDVEERLKLIGISDELTFDWIYRGSPTRIEGEIIPFFGFDSKWVAYGDEVRDQTLTFPEAIHNASYLRNRIAAHKFNERTQFISPYDVFNVQDLARQLIIRKIGLWETVLNKNI